MPNIPGSDPTPGVAPRPMETPYNGNRTSPEEFGAGAGQVAEQAGSDLGKIGAAYQERANAVADEAAFGKAQALLNNSILDEKTGFLGQKGSDALDKAQDYTDKFTNGLNQIRQSLSPAQWQRIGYRMDRLRESGLRLAATHERQQHDVIADATFRGAEAASTDTLAQMAGDPNTSPEQMKDALKQLVANGQNRAQYKYGANPPADAVKLESLPILNTASVKAMSEAVATGDPQHAERALQLFGPYLGVHAKLYTSAVNKMLAQQTIAREGEKILGAATDAVALPDGSAIARPSAGRIDAGLAAIKPDNQHAADILKYVEDNQKRQEKAFSDAAGEVYDRVRHAGTDPVTGKFRLDAPGVSQLDKVWLQQHGTEQFSLNKLSALDYRNQREATGEDRATSKEAYTGLYSDMINPARRLAAYGQMSQADFNAQLDDLPLTDDHKKLALKEFSRIKDAAGKLEETVPDVVNKTLEKALPSDPAKRKDLAGALGNAVQQFVDEHKAAHNGAAPDRATVSKFAEHEMADGEIVNPYWNDTMFRIEAQRDKTLVGKHFAVKDEPDEVIGAAPAPHEQQPAPKKPPEPSPQDKAALDWLADPKNATTPAADRVRAKLKAKGLVQ